MIYIFNNQSGEGLLVDCIVYYHVSTGTCCPLCPGLIGLTGAMQSGSGLFKGLLLECSDGGLTRIFIIICQLWD